MSIHGHTFNQVYVILNVSYRLVFKVRPISWAQSDYDRYMLSVVMLCRLCCGIVEIWVHKEMHVQRRRMANCRCHAFV